LKIVKSYAIEYRRRDLAEEDKKVKDSTELFCIVNPQKWEFVFASEHTRPFTTKLENCVLNYQNKRREVILIQHLHSAMIVF